MGGALSWREMCRDLYRRKKTGEPQVRADREGKTSIQGHADASHRKVSLALECEPAVARKRIEGKRSRSRSRNQRKIPYV